EPDAAARFLWKSVSVGPGSTALTRIPSPAWSHAIERVSPSTPALVASYCAMPGRPTMPFAEDTLTTAAWGRPTISGITCLHVRPRPTRLTATMWFQDSAVASVTGPHTRAAALLTSTST